MIRLKHVFFFFTLSLGILWTCFIACLTIVSYLISEKAGQSVVRLWGKGWCRLMGIHVEFKDLENLPSQGAAVLAPNHESLFDIFVLASLPVDFKWVAKVQVLRIPFVGLAMRAMGSYMVRRDRSSHDMNVMKEVEDGLKAGKSALIFPEGTRTRTGELLPLKKGAFRTAKNAGVPICPIAIKGTFAIAPPGHIPSHRGHRVTVRIGKPLAAPAEADIHQLMENYHKVLVDLLKQD